MNWLVVIRDWTMWLFEAYICWILTVEYFYDFRKDEEKKQRKTKTTKKTTTKPGGESTVEEISEVTEPVKEKSNEQL